LRKKEFKVVFHLAIFTFYYFSLSLCWWSSEYFHN